MSNPVDRARFWLDHRWTPPHLSDYLDDELADGPRRRTERHVAECKECRRLLAGLRQLIRMLHFLPTPAGPDAARIAASVRLRILEPGSP